MFSSSDVISAKDRLSYIFSDYDSKIAEIDNEIWSGDSKNNFYNQTSEFKNEFKSQIMLQLDYLNQAINLYEQYNQEKNNLSITQNNYNLAVSNNDTSMINKFSNQINSINSSINNIKSEIDSCLSNINGIVLEGSVLAQHEFVNYYQTDYNESYGYGSSIAEAGCGPTSMAMVLTYLKGESIDPVETANWSLDHGHRVKNNGTAWSFFNAIAEEYGVNSTQMGVSSSNITSNLQDGNMVIMSMGPGHFTTGGHFIVLTGMNEDGSINVADPYSRSKSEKTWDINIFLNEGKQMWSFSN